MRLLNTLYVDDHRARVSVSKRALEVRVERALVGRYPMEQLEAVVLTGAASVTTEALARCTRSGIKVTSMTRGGTIRFALTGPTRGNVLLRVAQLRSADDSAASLHIAKHFVAAKLQNQVRMLGRWRDGASNPDRAMLAAQCEAIRERLGAISRAEHGDRLRGLEGDGTRRYFKGLRNHLATSVPEIVFAERTRRPPRDAVNALLSFLYALITTTCAGALDATGLDPQIGFLHGLRPGRPALALDLLEEFRVPFADRFAVRTLARRTIRSEHFIRSAGGATYLSDDGRKLVIGGFEEYKSEHVDHLLLGRSVPRAVIPTVQATLLARYLRGDLPEYPPFVMAS